MFLSNDKCNSAKRLCHRKVAEEIETAHPSTISKQPWVQRTCTLVALCLHGASESWIQKTNSSPRLANFQIQSSFSKVLVSFSSRPVDANVTQMPGHPVKEKGRAAKMDAFCLLLSTETEECLSFVFPSRMGKLLIKQR